MDVQHRFQLTPEALTAPAWFQLARQEQAVQGPPPGHQSSFWGGLKAFPLVAASTQMFHIHIYLPDDGLRHILSLWASWPLPRSSPAACGTRDSPGRWMGGIASLQLVISPRSGKA